MGLSRNKVSLRERGDGSPPFYGEGSLTLRRSGGTREKPTNVRRRPYGAHPFRFEGSTPPRLLFENRILHNMFFPSPPRGGGGQNLKNVDRADLTSFFFCEVKFLEACSGCLGTDRRRKTRLPAISVGELEASFDPTISEWGNPARATSRHPAILIAAGVHPGN